MPQLAGYIFDHYDPLGVIHKSRGATKSFVKEVFVKNSKKDILDLGVDILGKKIKKEFQSLRVQENC